MEGEVKKLYIVGNSKSQQNNPITHVYGAFFVGFIVDESTGLITDVECNAIISITNEFLKAIFIGRHLSEDFEEIKNEIEKRYLASSQKAIIVAYKDALKKYLDYKSGKQVEL